MARRAREQELQRRQEKEKEAAMGFNPKPSKFMDLDELQSQGQSLTVLRGGDKPGTFLGLCCSLGLHGCVCDGVTVTRCQHILRVCECRRLLLHVNGLCLGVKVCGSLGFRVMQCFGACCLQVKGTALSGVCWTLKLC